VAGLTIGAYAFVGAGAVVTHDVRSFALVVGNPARVQGWVCACGSRLEVVQDGTKCDSCGMEFRQTEMGVETA
jgi:UDP-2-acetamido-3-amino-2,3-dideoxy-glucuronate N-acetyltransferase